ncbi:MAG: hypothetical protein ACPG7F_13580, partial [Aggregatilineales bacterium]
PQVLSMLERETEGNVFFMVEVVRALAEDVGGLANIGMKTLPEHIYTGGIDTLIQKRLMKVPVSYRRLLEIAAIVGRQLDMTLIAQAATNHQIDISEWVLACADAYILEIIDGQWRFIHDKIRESILRAINSTQSLSLYEDTARAIETVYPDNPDYAAMLIHLWGQAQNPAKEFPYLLQEGKRLDEMAGFQNFQDARLYFERALDLLQNSDLLHLTALEHETAHLDILLGLGVTFIGLNEMETAASWYQQAIEPGKKLQSYEKLAHTFAGLARIELVRGAPQEKTMNLADEGLHYAEKAEDSRAITVCHNMHGYIYAHYNNLEKSRKSFLAAVTVLESSGDDYETALMLNNVGKLEQIAGDYQQSRLHLEQARNLALQVGHFNTAILSTSNLGVLEFFCEDYEQSIAYFQMSINLMLDTGDHMGLSQLWVFQAFAEAETKDGYAAYESLLRAIDNRENANRDFSDMHIVMGVARWYLIQDAPQKSALLLGLAEHLGGSNPFMREWLDPLQKKLAKHTTDIDLNALLAQGATLDLNQTVDHIFNDFVDG